MSQMLTLEVPDDVVRRARYLAGLANRNVNEILADARAVALPALDAVSGAEECPISQLPDDEVLRLADLRLTPAQDRALSRLLDRQQAGTLTEDERAELLALMQVYQAGLLRKAEALSEAVQRGLREPLSP